mmetsp:Transcript_1315/g.4417  ORF Transcript_1315/g.4417 Transcript_1315/m.4417 type:complete len:85 (+) Transcript_1315:1304-1558(+)
MWARAVCVNKINITLILATTLAMPPSVPTLLQTSELNASQFPQPSCLRSPAEQAPDEAQAQVEQPWIEESEIKHVDHTVQSTVI